MTAIYYLPLSTVWPLPEAAEGKNVDVLRLMSCHESHFPFMNKNVHLTFRDLSSSFNFVREESRDWDSLSWPSQDHVQAFVKAVESDNVPRAEQLIIFQGENCHICVADCKAMVSSPLRIASNRGLGNSFFSFCKKSPDIKGSKFKSRRVILQTDSAFLHVICGLEVHTPCNLQ